MNSVYYQLSLFDAKLCTRCQQWQSLSSFSPAKGAKDGLTSHCKTCHNHANQERAKRPKSPSSDFKTCRDCRRLLPRSSFNRQRAAPDGVSNQCRECRKVRRVKWDTPERGRARYKIARQNLAVVQRVRAHCRTYYQRKKDEITARRSPGRQTETYRMQAKARTRAWYQAHPEQWLGYNRRRRAAKNGSGGTVTTTEWRALCEQYDNRCLACGNTGPLTADHIVPLSKGGRHDISNIQPLCRSCNSHKRTKTVDYRR